MVQLYDFLQLWNIKEPKCISFKALEQEVVVKAFKFFSSSAQSYLIFSLKCFV